MNRIKNFVAKIKGDDKLVVSLVLIAVAVGLCIIFRNEINTLLTSMFGDMTTAIEGLYAGTLS